MIWNRQTDHDQTAAGLAAGFADPFQTRQSQDFGVLIAVFDLGQDGVKVLDE